MTPVDRDALLRSMAACWNLPGHREGPAGTEDAGASRPTPVESTGRKPSDCLGRWRAVGDFLGRRPDLLARTVALTDGTTLDEARAAQIRGRWASLTPEKVRRWGLRCGENPTG